MKPILTNSFSVKWVVWQAESVINRFCGYLQTQTLEKSRVSQFHYIIQCYIQMMRLYLCFYLSQKCFFCPCYEVSHKNKQIAPEI